MKTKGISLLLAMVFTAGCTLPGTNLSAGIIPESTEGKDLTMGEAADSVFSLNINRKYSFNPLIATNHFNQLVCALVYENVVEVEMLKASWNKYWKGFLEQTMFEFDL